MVKRFLKTSRGRQVAAALSIGLVIGVIGPFGTFHELALPARLLYWMPLIALGWVQWILLLHAIEWLAGRVLAKATPPWWVRDPLLCVITPIPMAFEIIAFHRLFDMPLSASWTTLYVWTAILSLLIMGLVVGVIYWARLSQAGSENTTPTPAETEPSGAGLLDRLPMDKRGRLLCLKTEDHYLRVYTDRGEELILLRLTDALRELEGIDGFRVHRSYWVARAAVTEAQREGRKTRLRLSNGLDVPVSQTYLPQLKAAGWI